MPASEKDSPLLLIGALLAVYIIWGSTYLGIYFGIRGFPPLLLAGIRFTTAGLLFLAWILWRKEGVRVTRLQLKNVAFTSFLMLTMGNGLICIAEKTVPTGTVALLITSVPIFATLFSRFFGGKTSILEWIGILVGIVGVAILNTGAPQALDPTGVLLVLLSCAGWAFASISMQRIDMPKGRIATALQMLFAGISLLFLSFITGERLPAHQPWESIAGLIYLITFGSIIGYSAYIYVLQHTRPAVATSYAYVNPIVALLLGYFFANEMINSSIMLAVAVILSGVALIAFAQKRVH
jgi:drug/metabolite transporter (DMT)-like permease